MFARCALHDMLLLSVIIHSLLHSQFPYCSQRLTYVLRSFYCYTHTAHTQNSIQTVISLLFACRVYFYISNSTLTGVLYFRCLRWSLLSIAFCIHVFTRANKLLSEIVVCSCCVLSFMLAVLRLCMYCVCGVCLRLRV
jgi:hypothetical protein